MIEPYYADDTCTIYKGDALGVLAELPTRSIDICLTDPPYSSGGQFRGDRIRDVHTKYVRDGSEKGEALNVFSGDTRDQRGFGYWCALWLGELTRVLVDGAVCAVFTDWRQLPTMSDVIQSGGYVWRGIVPWHKPSGRRTQGRWGNTCEYIVWGTNGPRGLDGHALPGFYSVNAPRVREHITEKPVEILADLLKVVPAGSVVLDPFMGSGSTLVAAKLRGLKAIGIELDEHSCAIAVKRLAQQALPIGLEPVDMPSQTDMGFAVAFASSGDWYACEGCGRQFVEGDVVHTTADDVDLCAECYKACPIVTTRPFP